MEHVQEVLASCSFATSPISPIRIVRTISDSSSQLLYICLHLFRTREALVEEPFDEITMRKHPFCNGRLADVSRLDKPCEDHGMKREEGGGRSRRSRLQASQEAQREA